MVHTQWVGGSNPSVATKEYYSLWEFKCIPIEYVFFYKRGLYENTFNKSFSPNRFGKWCLYLFIKAIEEEIKVFQPDIIHSGHIWTLSNIAGNYDIPLIITAHGTDLIGFEKSERYKKECYEAYKKAKKIITISQDNKNLVDSIFGNEKSVLIPNGYDPEIFYPENIDKNLFLKQFGINKNYKNIISFAGKFTKEKGIDTLLKAAKIYENEDILTIIAGNGELFEQMNNLKNDLKIKNVIFIKNQPHNVLRQLYNIC